MIKFVNRHIQLIYALIIILLTGIFIVTVQLVRAPSVEAVTEYLKALPYFSTCENTEATEGAYLDISELCRIVIYKATDSTACEFAVASADEPELLEFIIERLKARKSELEVEFANNSDELRRIDGFKIINVDNLVAFMIYDTNRTAENALHGYFQRAGN